MDLFSLKNKNILVTGGAGLLGQKHVEAILIADGNPIVLDYSKSNLDYLKEDISERFNKKLDIFKIDITKEKEIIKLAEKFKKLKIQINGIINNAAINPTSESLNHNETRIENYSLSDWKKTLDVELTGSFLMLKHFGHLMYKQGLGGVVLNISSDLGLISPDQRLYENISKSPSEQKGKDNGVP